MPAKKDRKIKFISTLLVLTLVLIFLFSQPKPAQAVVVAAVPVNETGFMGILRNIFLGTTSVSTTVNTGFSATKFAKEVLQQSIMVFEKNLLQSMTKGITGWINNGFHGSPLFLTNSDSFFHDIAKSEIKNIVNQYGYDPNRFPFGQDFALNIINRYKTVADANAAYSLSAVMNPVMAQNYRDNFNAGGWNGFLTNTQYPQNNYLGFQMIATDQLARQLAGTSQNAAQKINTTLNQGMGFLSPQTCPTNPKYNNGYNEFNRPAFQSTLSSPTTAQIDFCYGPVGSVSAPGAIQACINQVNANYQRDLAAEKAKWAETNDCPGGLQNTTPGAVAANQIFKALGSSFDKTALGSMLEGSITAILDSLVSQFTKQGLNALGDTITGSSSSTDSWSYQGNTLVTNTSGSSTGTTTPTNTTFSVTPASVSVFPGNALNNITISGGTPPYILLGNCDNGGAGITQNITKDACIANTSGGGKWNAADPQFATVYASGTNITVIGVAAGNTSVTVQDSSIPAKIITLPIIITPTATTTSGTQPTTTEDPTGTCTLSDGTLTSGLTKSYCEAYLGGTWSLTTPTTTSTAPLGTCTITGTETKNVAQADCANGQTLTGNTGTWDPYGTCTPINGPVETNVTKGNCQNIHNAARWDQN